MDPVDINTFTSANIILGDDFMVHTSIVELSPPFISHKIVQITFLDDGLALEGNEIFHLRLIPLTPLNQTEIIFHDNVTLIIQDADGVFLKLVCRCCSK